MSKRCPDCGFMECACNEYADKALYLSRMIFGPFLDAIHGNDPPIFTPTKEEGDRA